jgi:hypothetical protein
MMLIVMFLTIVVFWHIMGSIGFDGLFDLVVTGLGLVVASCVAVLSALIKSSPFYEVGVKDKLLGCMS